MLNATVLVHVYTFLLHVHCSVNAFAIYALYVDFYVCIYMLQMFLIISNGLIGWFHCQRKLTLNSTSPFINSSSALPRITNPM